MTRILPNVVWRGCVACHSSRGGVKPRIIVIHDTEGGNIPHSSRDLFGLRDFFNRLSTQASAHAAADNDGNSIELVPDELKAWSCTNYNPVTLNLEMIHHAGEPYTEELYHEAARYVAWWCRKWDIPVRRGVAVGGVVLRSGIVTHRYLGLIGGGHFDPIPPWNQRKFRRLVACYYKLQQAHHKI